MSLIKKFSWFQKDKEIYITEHGVEHRKHAASNKIFIKPFTRMDSLSTVKREMKQTKLNK